MVENRSELAPLSMPYNVLKIRQNPQINKRRHYGENLEPFNSFPVRCASLVIFGYDSRQTFK